MRDFRWWDYFLLPVLIPIWYIRAVVLEGEEG